VFKERVDEVDGASVEGAVMLIDPLWTVLQLPFCNNIPISCTSRWGNIRRAVMGESIGTLVEVL